MQAKRQAGRQTGVGKAGDQANRQAGREEGRNGEGAEEQSFLLLCPSIEDSQKCIGVKNIQIYKNLKHVSLYICLPQVSWIRKSDSAILAVDNSVFVSDSRMTVLTSSALSSWTLLIQ